MDTDKSTGGKFRRDVHYDAAYGAGSLMEGQDQQRYLVWEPTKANAIRQD